MVWGRFKHISRLLRHHCSDRRQSSGGNAGDGELTVTTDEAVLAHPPFTSCCVAQFLRRFGNPGLSHLIILHFLVTTLKKKKQVKLILNIYII